jgi:hypothetical protein
LQIAKVSHVPAFKLPEYAIFCWQFAKRAQISFGAVESEKNGQRR